MKPMTPEDLKKPSTDTWTNSYEEFSKFQTMEELEKYLMSKWVLQQDIAIKQLEARLNSLEYLVNRIMENKPPYWSEI